MNVVSLLVKKIAGFFLAIIATFRKLMCFLHIVRQRKNSGSLLPMTTKHMVPVLDGDVQQSLPSNDYELQSWDSWGSDPLGGSTEAHMNNHHAVPNHVGNQKTRMRSQSETEQEPDIDYFQDMVPKFKKSTRILVRKKDDTSGRPGGLSSRLAMSPTEVPSVLPGSELGQWDESESAWSPEVMEDLSWEADSALKEKKRQEREHRQQEQQQKKLQKERERNMRSGGQFSAIKLS